MKRKAIIIANVASDLPGTQVDIANIRNFLKSLQGGAWYEHEICILENPSRASLITELNDVKKTVDFSIVFFTGHGDRDETQTRFNLNDSGQLMFENDLKGLSPRQINVFDCCRVLASGHVANDMMLEAAMESYSSRPELLTESQARMLYQRRIENTPPQTVTLYSCSEDEYSLDTENGGLFISSLLKQAEKFSNSSQSYRTALSCIGDIQDAVRQKSARVENNAQNPAWVAPRLLPENQLILSLNPYLHAHL